MKMKLMVSYDAGCSYQQDMETNEEEDYNKMATRAMQLDKEWLRWVIEDDSGEYIAVSRIHRKLLAMIDALNKR